MWITIGTGLVGLVRRSSTDAQAGLILDDERGQVFVIAASRLAKRRINREILDRRAFILERVHAQQQRVLARRQITGDGQATLVEIGTARLPDRGQVDAARDVISIDDALPVRIGDDQG